jgi:hypothetical protein
MTFAQANSSELKARRKLARGKVSQRNRRPRSSALLVTALKGRRNGAINECVQEKYAVQAKHFAQAGGDMKVYSKLVAKKYKQMMKRRAKREPAGAK